MSEQLKHGTCGPTHRDIERTNPVIALAGASGDLGFRIARALIERGADVRALVRPDVLPAERTRLEAIGLDLTEAHPGDRDALASACAGATCVVSGLNGVHDVMIDRQGVLLDAAVQADVPRFIPSDYSADFTQTAPGQNRNFDLRREFMARADKTPIKVTSILNGAFLDMLGAEMPIIQRRIHRVLYWHDVDQALDFTRITWPAIRPRRRSTTRRRASCGSPAIASACARSPPR